MRHKRVILLWTALALPLLGTARLVAAEGTVQYEMGKPFEIRLAAATNLVLSVETISIPHPEDMDLLLIYKSP